MTWHYQPSARAASLLGAVTLTSITVSPSTATLVTGATQQFAATGHYSDGSTADVTETATWSTADSGIATVNSSGLATGVATGVAQIDATIGAVTGSTEVTVIELSSIVVTPATASITISGTQQFVATGHYSDSSTADITASVTWSSSNESVATIDGSGLASPVADGSVTITAESGAISGTAGLTVASVLSGTTLAAWRAGSFSYQWVAQIEGCKFLLSEAPTAAVAAAYAGTDWDPTTNSDAVILGECLFVELHNEQKLDPWKPFGRGGTAILRIMPDAADQFGIYASRRGHGAETSLGATIDRNDTSISLSFGTDFAAPPSTAFIGTECIKYSAVTSTSMTASVRGFYSPLASGTSTRFANHHRVGLDPTQVQMDPVISQEPRVWVGKRVALRMHLWDGTSLNSIDDSYQAFSGRIASIADDPDTGCMVIEVKHQLDEIADAIVFRDQYVGEVPEGIYLQSTGKLQITETIAGVDAAGNSLTLTAGNYSLSEIYALLNDYTGGELAAGRITGSYTWKQESTASGPRTVCRFSMPNPGATSVAAYWVLSMPSEMAGFLGFENGTMTNVGQSARIAPSGTYYTPNSGSRVSEDEPYVTFATHFNGPNGPSFQAEMVNERGIWTDQRSLLPSGIRHIADGVEATLYSGVAQSWGIFQIDEKVLAFGTYDLATHTFANVYVAPWRLSSDPIGSIQQIGRKASDQSGPITIKQILFLESSFAKVVKYMFYSTGTAGYNSADFDALGYGAGIGVPAENLGSDFETSIDSLPGADAPLLVVLTKPTKLVDALSSDLILRRASLIWKEGGLQFTRWKTPLVGLATYTLDEDNKAAPSNANENHRTPALESGVFQRPIVTVKFNRDFSTSDETYLRSITLEDQTAVDDGGGNAEDVGTVTISARNTYAQFSETGAPMESLIKDFLAHFPMVSRAWRMLTRSIALPLYESLYPGDVVIVNDNYARDPLTGLRRINGRAALVTRIAYDPGGPSPAVNGQPQEPRQMAGEVDLFFFDSHRGAEYGAAAMMDDTANASGFTAGYGSATTSLRCYAHKYSESSEQSDALNFTTGDVIDITEIDPSNTASPITWRRTVAGQSTATDIFLTSALSSPAFDATKKYRITPAPYASATVTQQDHAYQADTTDQMIVDVDVADHYASTTVTENITPNVGTDLADFLPDQAYGDGVSLDCGNDVAQANLANMLIDRKTAHQSPFLSSQMMIGSAALDTWSGRFFGICYLGTEMLSTSVYRMVTVAPWFQLDNAHGATSGQVRVTFSRELPKVAQGVTDDGTGAPYFDGHYNQLTWTTTSTAWAIGADQTFYANIKEVGTGMLYVTIEVYNAKTRGLAKFIEGVRLLA